MMSGRKYIKAVHGSEMPEPASVDEMRIRFAVLEDGRLAVSIKTDGDITADYVEAAIEVLQRTLAKAATDHVIARAQGKA